MLPRYLIARTRTLIGRLSRQTICLLSGCSCIAAAACKQGLGSPERASVSADRRAQRGSRFVGQGEDLNIEGILFASQQYASEEFRIRKAGGERGLIPGPVGLADTTAGDEAATSTALALMEIESMGTGRKPGGVPSRRGARAESWTATRRRYAGGEHGLARRSKRRAKSKPVGRSRLSSLREITHRRCFLSNSRTVGEFVPGLWGCGLAFPLDPLSPGFRPNDPRREFANSRLFR
jgi:hypothetical protein